MSEAPSTPAVGAAPDASASVGAPALYSTGQAQTDLWSNGILAALQPGVSACDEQIAEVFAAQNQLASQIDRLTQGTTTAHRTELGPCLLLAVDCVHCHARRVGKLCTGRIADCCLVPSFVASCCASSHGNVPVDFPLRLVGALHGEAGRVPQARQEADERRRESAVETRRHSDARPEERGAACGHGCDVCSAAEQTGTVTSGCVDRLQRFFACAIANCQCGSARSIDRVRHRRCCCDPVRRWRCCRPSR